MISGLDCSNEREHILKRALNKLTAEGWAGVYPASGCQADGTAQKEGMSGAKAQGLQTLEFFGNSLWRAEIQEG